MKTLMTLITLLLGVLVQSRAAAPSVTVTGTSAGPTPFISMVSLTADDPRTVAHIDFKIIPKDGSVTRPVFARYTSAYLRERGYFNTGTGTITVPVFCLYQNHANTVILTTTFTNRAVQRNTLTVQTDPWNDPTGVYLQPTVNQARTKTRTLSYDFMLLKNFGSPNTPIIMDTDCEIRWAGTAGIATTGAILFANGLYIADGATGLIRMEFDGTYTKMADYNGIGVTGFHHNFDYGKHGILVAVDTTDTTECVNLEVDAAGNVLKTWNLAQIISDAMAAGGDDPTQFVKPHPVDWFHNNATIYRRRDNSVIVSSRENFVIAIDYQSGAIKWILGDPTKRWYQFPSLKKYALRLGPKTLAPIGQHAVSFFRDRLLLFDNGAPSLQQSPAGNSRSYSSPRKYAIKTRLKTATEVWNYEVGQSLNSAYCSSVYEDRENNYLVTYATITLLVGLDRYRRKIFEYQYPTLAGCGTAWNAVPIHLEALRFDFRFD